MQDDEETLLRITTARNQVAATLAAAVIAASPPWHEDESRWGDKSAVALYNRIVTLLEEPVRTRG